ncbi:MAG: hypothetical protein R6W97_00715 [Thiobacillus sp.]
MCFRLRDNHVANHPVRKMLPLADYLFKLTRTYMATISRQYLSDDLWLNTVLIETEGMSPLEFHIAPEQKTSLFQSGHQTTHNFLPVKLARKRETEI